jgi:hypothetical protein
VDVGAAFCADIGSAGRDGMVLLTLRDVHSQEVGPAFERWVQDSIEGRHRLDWRAELQLVAPEGAVGRKVSLCGAFVTETRAPRDPYHLYDTVGVAGYDPATWANKKNVGLYTPYAPLQVSTGWPGEETGE